LFWSDRSYLGIGDDAHPHAFNDLCLTWIVFHTFFVFAAVYLPSEPPDPIVAMEARIFAAYPSGAYRGSRAFTLHVTGDRRLRVGQRVLPFVSPHEAERVCSDHAIYLRVS
jgi:hypothetical protein